MGNEAPPGFYVDKNSGRERWWDGSGWTDHIKAAERREDFDLMRVGVAVIGAIVAIVGVFLSVATATASGEFVHASEISLSISANALIDHPEGVAVIAIVALAFIISFQGAAVWRAASFVGGLAVIGFAVAAGINPPVEQACRLFGSTCEGLAHVNVGPGVAVWFIGAGGLVIAMSALIPTGGVRFKLADK